MFLDIQDLRIQNKKGSFDRTDYKNVVSDLSLSGFSLDVGSIENIVFKIYQKHEIVNILWQIQRQQLVTLANF